MSNPSVPGLLSFFSLFLAFLSSPAVAHPNYPGGCSVTATGGHGTTLKDDAHNAYVTLSHDGGTDPLVNSRVIITLGGFYSSFKGFILRTNAGTLTPKKNAAIAQYCSGAVGHTDSSYKSEAQAYLDLPSTPGTVTVTAEVVKAVDDVYEISVDIHVVEVNTTWTQVGPNASFWSGNYKRFGVDGMTGFSVSMNSDGSRLAMGSPSTDAWEVRVVDYDESTQTEQVSTISKIGTGSGVALSGDGTLLAILDSQFGTGPIVRKYDASSKSWTEFSSVDQFFKSTHQRAVAMSRDGSRVVYITYASSAHRLEVFDIDSANSAVNYVIDVSLGAGGGQSVAISADGNRVVVGRPAEGSSRGEVKVYEINGNAASVIATIGGDITSPQGRFGASVAISGDGKRIVVGAPGRYEYGWANTKGSQPYVHVYEESAESSWVKLGDDITMPQVVEYPSSPGTFLYAFGISVAISDDGSIVAIRSATAGSRKGGTFLHKLNSATGDWRRSGNEIEDDATVEIDIEEGGILNEDYSKLPVTAVSLSGDGKYVAIGAPWYRYPDWTLYKSGQVRVFKDPNPTPASPAPPSSSSSCSSSRATGGTITTFGDYVIHNFTSSGIFTVTDSSLTEVDVLVVGGGGGGGSPYGAGGGGGGAVLYSANATLSSSPITVTVGNGGIGADPSAAPGDGGASSFDGLVANGGKGGIGSGGQGGASGSENAGGSGVATYAGGGGGGAIDPGEAANEVGPGNYDAGDGGLGIESAISGASIYYGGGGGGGTTGGNHGNGGLGGGGRGKNSPDPGDSGSAFTGGGGGGSGGGPYNGGSGGSGVIIVRYKKATCNDQSCATDYYHDGSDCAACPTGSTRMPDTANECLCPRDYHRRVDGGVYSCAACAQGTSRPAGDTVPGGDATTCSAGSSSSPSPGSSSPSPTSAQDKKAAAEKTRDLILADIADARLKAKAKLLADAAIAGVKVQRLTAKLSAADEDTACSAAFTNAEMSASDGACVVKAASSGKRRLSATTYDVEIMFSSAVVSDDALTKAADALKANGVDGVTSETSVDPIAELKVIPGIDTSKLQTFDNEAAEAAASAPSVSTQPPPPPPTPNPPPPNLVQDDGGRATGHRGVVAFIAVAAVLLLQ